MGATDLEGRGPDDSEGRSLRGKDAGPAGRQMWKRSVVLGLVLGALAIRLAFMLGLGTYRFDRGDDTSSDNEIGHIAISIVEGRGFSSPFSAEYTGPSAWVSPVYPYFVALVFRCLGPLTNASYICIFSVQALLSALTVIPILSIASLTVGRRAGLWAAGLWAFFPWFGRWSVTWVWETTLSALLFAMLFAYALYLPEATSRKTWIGFGALWGFALLVNPTWGTLLPVSLAWCGYKRHLRKQEWLQPAVISLLVCLVVVSPWVVRNRLVFKDWVFLRGTFGCEFALGNYHTSFGRGWIGRHPSGNTLYLEKYSQMGELAYCRWQQQEAMQFVRDYPWEFITLTAKRVAYFWDGSAMGYRPHMAWYWIPSSYALISFLLLPALLVAYRMKLYGWELFYGALLTYPIPYYLTVGQVRHRHVIEPIILLLLAYAGVVGFGRIARIGRAPDTGAAVTAVE